MSELLFKNLGLSAKSWPFIEAKKILNNIGNKAPSKGYVLFETGYGPSGLPHIGTFGEVARTSMVRYAFSQLSDIPTALFAFSDDLDGFRKVPSNVPNQELLAQYLGKPLTEVPDPFGKYNSFGEHNNAMLCQFLDSFGFDYEFQSATQYYKSGKFNDALLKALQKHEEIKNIILPTLGEERAETYSPFLPIDPNTREVLQVKVIKTDIQKGTIVYINAKGEEIETEVTDGKCKLQWKADWALRWFALEVDYEMSGKDLIPSVQLSSKICKVLGRNPPQNLTYELFLDKNGEKISKSKGNGLSIDQWLSYGNKESLSYFMYQKPQTAKRLYLELIPKSVDEWLSQTAKYDTLTEEAKLESPIFFIHKNNPPKGLQEISFSLILNLVAVVKSDNKDLLWDFISKYHQFNKESKEIVDDLLTYAINYYNDFIKPTLKFKIPNTDEKNLLQQLIVVLQSFKKGSSASDVQGAVYKIGKDNELELRDWFALLYEVLLGQTTGPRMGSFFALYGIENSINLINEALDKKA